jgi:5-methylcytosine-specific restriction endonuclease McrA
MRQNRMYDIPKYDIPNRRSTPRLSRTRAVPTRGVLSVKNLIEVSLGHAVGSEMTRGRFCLTCPYEGDVDEEFCPDCFVVLHGNTRIQQPLSRVKYARHKTYSDSPNPNKSFSYSWEEDTTPVPYMAEEGSTYPRNVAGREVRKLTRTLNRLTKDLDYMVRVSRYHTWRGTDVRLKLDDCCYLCGRLTDPTSSHGMYPTVDHVIPQAAVEDSRQVPASVVYSTSNLRSAHMLCNTRKNDKNLGDLELPYDPPQDWDATDIAERWALYDLIIAIQDRLRELRGYVPQKTWDSVVVAYRGREDQQHKMAVLKLPEKLPIVGS